MVKIIAFVLFFCASVSGAQAQALLEITKSASTPVVIPGAQLVYTLEIANVGDVAATNVEVEDDLSSRLSFISATGGGTIGGQGTQGPIVRWNFPTILPGERGSVSVVTSADFAGSGTSFTNVATIVSDQTPEVISNIVVVEATTAPNILLGKAASRAQAVAGDEVVYTLNYLNAGGSAATNVFLSDILSPNLSFVSASNNGNYDAGSRTVSWSSATLEAGLSGSVTFSAVVNPVADGTIIDNIASIDTDQTSPISSNSVGVTVTSDAAISVIATSSPSPIAPGDILSFTTEVTNTSTNAAEGLVITGIVPANTSYVDSLGGGTFSADTVTWDIGNIGPLQTASVVMRVAVDPSATDGTEIQYSTSAAISNGTNAGAGLIVYVSSSPKLLVQKSAPSTTISAGDSLTYTIEFTNTGGDASEAVLRDYLPGKTAFVSASGGGSHNNGVVTWNLGTLSSGATASVEVATTTATPLANGSLLHNVATLEAINGFPVTATFDVTASTLPNLMLSKVASQSIVEAGERLSYALTLQNTGASAATNVVVADILPSDVSFVSASDGGDETAPGSGIVVWNAGGLTPGSQRFFLLTVEVNDVVPNGTVLHNASSITSNETAPSQALVVDTLVDSRPVLSLSKQASVTTVLPGNSVEYTLIYENTGSDTATGLVMSEIVPPNTTFVSASNGGSFDPATYSVTWNLGNLDAGSADSVTMTVTVDGDTPADTIISNTASIRSTETPPIVSSATVSVSATPPPPSRPNPIPTLPVFMLVILAFLIGTATHFRMRKM